MRIKPWQAHLHVMDALLAAAAGLELEDDDAGPLLEARDADIWLRTLRLPRPCTRPAMSCMVRSMQTTRKTC